MAVSDFLWGGSRPTTLTSASSNDQFFPAWYTDYVKGILAKGNAVADSPYPTFQGPRVADLSQDEQTAIGNIRDNIGRGSGTVDTGISMTSGAGTPGLNRSVFDTYQSPHIEGVVNRIAELGGRNLSENLLPAVNDTFIGGGQFGSGRHADFTGRAVRDANESILGQQAQALQAGFDSSMNAYNQGQNRSLVAGENLGALGRIQQSMGLIDSTALMGAGTLERELAQRGLDTGYEEFMRQSEYPKTQLGFLSALLRGSQVPTSTSQINAQTQTGGNNGLASLLGLASGAAGAAKLFQ